MAGEVRTNMDVEAGEEARDDGLRVQVLRGEGLLCVGSRGARGGGEGVGVGVCGWAGRQARSQREGSQGEGGQQVGECGSRGWRPPLMMPLVPSRWGRVSGDGGVTSPLTRLAGDRCLLAAAPHRARVPVGGDGRD